MALHTWSRMCLRGHETLASLRQRSLNPDCLTQGTTTLPEGEAARAAPRRTAGGSRRGVVRPPGRRAGARSTGTRRPTRPRPSPDGSSARYGGPARCTSSRRAEPARSRLTEAVMRPGDPGAEEWMSPRVPPPPSSGRPGSEPLRTRRCAGRGAQAEQCPPEPEGRDAIGRLAAARFGVPSITSRPRESGPLPARCRATRPPMECPTRTRGPPARRRISETAGRRYPAIREAEAARDG